jgi:hypothetical protein
MRVYLGVWGKNLFETMTACACLDTRGVSAHVANRKGKSHPLNDLRAIAISYRAANPLLDTSHTCLQTLDMCTVLHLSACRTCTL